MFIDQVTIRVEGGTGGSGADAFRRESGVPRGGPSGGDGGDGGSVVLVCDPQLSTLLDFRYRAEYRAERGAHGEGSNRTGRKGEDLELKVPPGTIVRDAESDELLAELLREGERFVAAPGGRGGRGNARFATATRQAPRHWEPGAEGVQRTIRLTLKLIADIGLVGEPNAGKSTFLSSVSAARPKVADYPFTTLTPALGVVELSDHRSFVVADIPGIIEGAHEGKGLGHQFLQHIERTRSLALLIPVDAPDPTEVYLRLREELGRYSPALAERAHCVVLTKGDLLGPEDPAPEVSAPEAWGVFLVSSVSRQGLDGLLESMWKQVDRSPEAEDAPFSEEAGAEAPAPVRLDPGPRTGDDEPPGEEEGWWDALDAED